mgnify:CR=1 FL=1
MKNVFVSSDEGQFLENSFPHYVINLIFNNKFQPFKNKKKIIKKKLLKSA